MFVLFQGSWQMCVNSHFTCGGLEKFTKPFVLIFRQNGTYSQPKMKLNLPIHGFCVYFKSKSQVTTQGYIVFLYNVKNKGKRFRIGYIPTLRNYWKLIFFRRRFFSDVKRHDTWFGDRRPLFEYLRLHRTRHGVD